jgi:glycosyltransferase involved in cell wall biosynthesis
MALGLGRPLIQSVRGNDIGRNSFDASRRPALRLALAPALRVVAVNRWLADLIAWNWPELSDRLVVVPNGVRVQQMVSDSEVRQARRAFGLPADGPVVGTVGTVREKKGPFVLDALMRGFLRQKRGRLLVIGELRLGEFKALGWTGAPADDEILFVRKAETRDELRLLISLCDWLVFPSLDDGMANGLLETMEAGRPVIVSAVFGDVVRDGRDGLVASSLTPDEFVRKSEWLWESPEARRALGESARSRAMARFSEDIESASWLELYRQTLSRCTPEAGEY